LLLALKDSYQRGIVLPGGVVMDEVLNTALFSVCQRQIGF